MGMLGLPGWLRSEPRLRMAGVGRLGLPGWVNPSPDSGWQGWEGWASQGG